MNWDSLLKDPRAGDGVRMRQRKLSEIQRHVLRVSCRRCERVVEIQTIDAVRLYGGNAVWNDVAQRLLDNLTIRVCKGPEDMKKTGAGRGSRILS